MNTVSSFVTWPSFLVRIGTTVGPLSLYVWFKQTKPGYCTVINDPLHFSDLEFFNNNTARLIHYFAIDKLCVENNTRVYFLLSFTCVANEVLWQFEQKKFVKVILELILSSLARKFFDSPVSKFITLYLDWYKITITNKMVKTRRT